MKLLYSFYADYGRGGAVRGLFLAEEKDVAKAIGKTVRFGEILGKHSNVECELVTTDFSVLSRDSVFNSQFELIVGEFGYNPLNYLDDEEDDEEGE